MACSNIRYGLGCSAEVGKDLKNMNAKKAMVVTDKNVSIVLDFCFRRIEPKGRYQLLHLRRINSCVVCANWLRYFFVKHI